MRNSNKTFGKLTMPLLFLFAVCSFTLPSYAQPWFGGGEPNDPYLIYDANDMRAIRDNSQYCDAHFKLMADIDLGSFAGIGSFTGVFDGNDHTISNLTTPLFGSVNDPNAEIKNLG
jgi:hypothetical protein